MVAAAIAAAGSLLAGGAAVAGQLSRGGSGGLEQQKLDLSQQQLADARENEQYQRMVSALINQRSVAGQTDSFGSSMEYDPGTNTWRSKLGALPFAAQTAADQAGISRNTTDMRQAQLANEISARRATEAGPAADAARRNVQDYRPMSSDRLVGLLQGQATNAANATFAPLRADTLRQFQRSGTGAAPVLAALGKSENDALRDSLIDAQIKGMTGVDQINQGRRQGLEQTAANTATLANPNFQYPGITPHTDDMAKTVAARASQGAAIPAYGMGGVNTGSTGSQAAYKNLRDTMALPSNSLTEAGKSIGSMLSNTDLQKNLRTAYGGLFGPGEVSQSGDPLLNYAQQSNDIERNWAKSQGSSF
jgi:hypothetical protein